MQISLAKQIRNRKAGLLIASTSLLVAASVAAAKSKNVSRQLSSPSRRKGSLKDPRGSEAPGRREVREPVLHHQPGWQGCRSVSPRGMAEGGRKARQGRKF